MIHRNSLLIGLIVGSIVAVILYFFVLERPADAAESQNRELTAESVEGPELLFPVECIIGQDCWYMAHVDLDSGESYRDYMCGIRTYDAHKGTDIAPDRDSERKLVVRAAAAGRVVGTRDGLVDIPMEAPESPRDAARCGNGVRLEHKNGWTTQYCYLAKGSVAVRSGDAVKPGQRLGEIGSSGWSELPHLHFQLERNGVPFDPFVGARAASGSDCDIRKQAGSGFWNDGAANNAISYQPSQIVRMGLTTAAPDRESAKFHEYPERGPRDAGALVAFGCSSVCPREHSLRRKLTGRPVRRCSVASAPSKNRRWNTSLMPAGNGELRTGPRASTRRGSLCPAWPRAARSGFPSRLT